MSPINFKDFGSAEPSLTSPIAELELSMHSIKEAPSEGRDAPREPVAAVCVEGVSLIVLFTFVRVLTCYDSTNQSSITSVRKKYFDSIKTS